MKKKDKLDIIYEDKDIIVVDKPSGLLTISTEREKEKTLFHKVLLYEKKKNKNNKIFIVHRLDRETSGIVLFAKNTNIKSKLQNNWNNIAISREYIAITEGIPKERIGTIISYLYEDNNYYVHVTKDLNKGLKAITNYRVIDTKNNYSFLAINIKTGRKNQIRVQLSSIGCPIVGDKKYGSKKSPINRFGLHCNKLEIINPINSKKMVFETDIPKNFENFIK